MLTQEILRAKREKVPLKKEEIEFFCKGVADQTVSEGQIAAFCMAVLLNGMTVEERVNLTMAMAHSGKIIDWSGDKLDGPVLDKHSTGGVGDKVSLILAPLVAACGGHVPMISGRGLGHTGGTLDKMDSIPGYVTQPELESLKAVVKNAGCAIVGATHDIAPADRAMYAVRDVTATVESIDLITASILSKKLAAGLDSLVMDVKFGSGAFMPDYDDAKALAESIVNVANGAGLKCSALLTDMNQVLGHAAGNAIEVIEAIEFLRGGHRDCRLHEVTLGLVAELLVRGGLAKNTEDGLKKAQENLDNGNAAEKFNLMVSDLGGPKNIMDDYRKYVVRAPVQHEVYARDQGIVNEIDARKLGLAIIELGGGRRLATDTVDYSVGLEHVENVGKRTGPNEKPLAVVFAQNEDSAKKAEATILDAFTIGDTTLEEMPVIREKVGAS